MDADSDYEAQRQANIKKNMEILLSLGLQPVSRKTAHSLSAAAKKAAIPSPSKKQKLAKSSPLKPHSVVIAPAVMTRRRSVHMTRSNTQSSSNTSSSSSSSDDDSAADAYKLSTSPPLRRSGRKRRAPAGTTYGADQRDGDDSDSDLTSLTSLSDDEERKSASFHPSLTPAERDALVLKRRQLDRLDREARQSQPARLPTRIGKRIHDPKTFGAIPGIEVGHWWASRMEVSTAAVHAPPVSGISGNREVGCWSIALSGGYEDDLELGEDQFTYTGCGGRKLSGVEAGRSLNLRTAPQSSDQSFDNNLNASLVKSCETGLPIRVIKGFKDVKSDFSPPTGYVYQGLYYVEKCWMQPGMSGFKVCKFAFRRCPGQPPMRSFREEKEEMRRVEREREEEMEAERELTAEREVIVIDDDDE